MSVLGIDASYSGLGVFALYDNSNPLDVRMGVFKKSQFGNGVQRLRAISTWMWDLLVDINLVEPIKEIVMEGYAIESKFAREQMGELGATIKSVIYDWGHGDSRYPTIVAPTQLKKFVTGSGRAQKEDMIQRVKEKWGLEFKDHNIADAYGLARIGLLIPKVSSNDLSSDWTEIRDHEFEVLSKLTRNTEKWEPPQEPPQG